jgi:uncharacterized protein (TIGR02391 family)
LSAAREIQQAVDDAGLVAPVHALPAMDEIGPARFDEIVTSDVLRAASRRLFLDGYYARAVEEAFKCLNNTVKDRSGLASKDGADLMREAFSANAPVLKINDLRSQSQKDEQRGYMDIYAGAMTGVRNPRAHDHRLDDEPEAALELLALANHLMRRLDAAKRSRRRGGTRR